MRVNQTFDGYHLPIERLSIREEAKVIIEVAMDEPFAEMEAFKAKL